MYAKKIEWWTEKFIGSSEVGSFPYAMVFVSIHINDRNVNNIAGCYINATESSR